MTTTPARERTTDAQVAENLATCLHRSRVKQQTLAHELGMTGATLSRRMSLQQPWMLWEVQAIAAYFGMTLSEMTTDLPLREEWQVRWDEARARRDSNPKPSDP